MTSVTTWLQLSWGSDSADTLNLKQRQSVFILSTVTARHMLSEKLYIHKVQWEARYPHYFLYLSFGSDMKQITLHSYHLRVIILSSCAVIFLYPFWLWYLIIKFYVMFAHLSFADDTSISSTSVFSLVFDTTWSHYSTRGLNVYRY